MFKAYSSSSSLVITSRWFATSHLVAPESVRLVYCWCHRQGSANSFKMAACSHSAHREHASSREPCHIDNSAVTGRTPRASSHHRHYAKPCSFILLLLLLILAHLLVAELNCVPYYCHLTTHQHQLVHRLFHAPTRTTSSGCFMLYIANKRSH